MLLDIVYDLLVLTLCFGPSRCGVEPVTVAAAFFISFFVFITILDFGKISLFLK